MLHLYISITLTDLYFHYKINILYLLEHFFVSNIAITVHCFRKVTD